MEEYELRPPPTVAKRVALLVTLLALGTLAVIVGGRLSEATDEMATLEEEREAAAGTSAEPTEVIVRRPQARETAAVVVLTGTLEPTQAADLGFRVPGRVSAVHVVLGQHVASGDVLVTLDSSRVGVQSAQSVAAIQVAQASVDMAADRVRRLEPLVASGTLASQELVTARQQLAIAEAQRNQARAGRRQVAVSSSDHRIRAPFDGVVTRVPSGVGVAANPGVPLVRVEDLSSLRLRTTVNRGQLQSLRVGMPVELDESDAVGTLEAVVRSLDTQTRRAPVEVRLPNTDGALVANSFTRARVTVGEARAALLIPNTARRPDGSVYVVGEGSRIESRAVTADLADDGDWLVTDGLSPDDRVLLRPAGMEVGTVVVPVEPAAGPETTAALEP